MSKKKKMDSLIFFIDHMEIAEQMLEEDERGRLYEALRVYAIEQRSWDTTKESRAWQAVYRMMCAAQNKAIKRYEDTCARNRERALKRVAEQPAAAGGCRGSQSNLIKSNQIKSNQGPSGETSSLSGEEVKGVPGVAWM